MNASHFGLKRSKVKVTVEYHILETALLAFTTHLDGGIPYWATWRRVIFIQFYIHLYSPRVVGLETIHKRDKKYTRIYPQRYTHKNLTN